MLVELAPINNPDLVPAAIAEALGLGERPGRKPVEVVVAYLQVRRALLVLDNFEHVTRHRSSRNCWPAHPARPCWSPAARRWTSPKTHLSRPTSGFPTGPRPGS